MDVDCLCLGEEDITSSRENITNCFMSCPNDPLMNSCGNLQLMSVCKYADSRHTQIKTHFVIK